MFSALYVHCVIYWLIVVTHAHLLLYGPRLTIVCYRKCAPPSSARRKSGTSKLARGPRPRPSGEVSTCLRRRWRRRRPGRTMTEASAGASMTRWQPEDTIGHGRLAAIGSWRMGRRRSWTSCWWNWGWRVRQMWASFARPTQLSPHLMHASHIFRRHTGTYLQTIVHSHTIKKLWCELTIIKIFAHRQPL